ncbi:MAG: hypothetical protein HY716_11810 [Planctomycetes bacterium]|nr:hypothetical protein [Planctomycetota bacterium]
MNPAPHGSNGVPVIGSAAGLRFELELQASESLEALADPFVALHEAGPQSRVLLARIADASGASLRPIALKIQRSGADPSSATNPQIDASWRNKRRSLEAARGDEVVGLFDLGGGSEPLKPVTFCKKMRCYFHPLCPSCRKGFLEDCRDDGLLRDSGLPAYSESSERYLYCPRCAAERKEGPRAFYRQAAAPHVPGREGVRIVVGAALYRDFARALSGDLAEADREFLRRHFPCFGCALRSECYPAETGGASAIPAESRLVPLSFHEFHALALEALHVHFDELMDLLGGRPWDDLRRGASEPEGRAGLLSLLDAKLSAPLPWLFRRDSTGRFPLEVLYLKLTALAQLFRGLRRWFATAGPTFSGLDASKVMAEFRAAETDWPAYWNFKVKLLDLAPGPGVVAETSRPPLRRLGLLFLRALAVHDRQDPRVVEQAAQRVLAKLADAAPSGGGPSLKEELVEQARWQLEAERDVFDSSGLLYAEADRKESPNLVPKRLWSDLLVFGLRLLSELPDFGWPASDTQAALDQGVEAMRLFVARTFVELFDAAGRNEEVRRVCQAGVGGSMTETRSESPRTA